MNSRHTTLLEVEGLTKRYGETTVVDDCSLSFHRGEIHALLGANGAGKSTLVRMIAGLVSPTAGRMHFGGQPYSPATKRKAEMAGIEIVQQELNLISTLSVAENLLLTRLPANIGIISRERLHAQARTALNRFGLTNISTRSKVAELGVGQQQMVEITKALAQDCRLLILDEPTAALSPAESESLFSWLRQLKLKGVGIIYISHRLDEISRLADQISILRDGHHVGTFPTRECSTDRMVELMSGRSAYTATATNPPPTRNRTALRVEGICGGPIHDVSFNLYEGEKLGFAGLVGSGRTELLRLIFGADKATKGCVYLNQDMSPYRFKHPSEAVSAGLAMVTEDRKDNGLLLSQSIRANTTITSLWKRFSRCGIIQDAAEIRSAREQCDSLGIRSEHLNQPVRTLSGGNQQKVAIAKWLVHDANVFLFDEPTRGIDVAARRRIYHLLDTLSKRGKGIIMVSSDLDELREVCDRIAIISAGRLVDIFTRDNWSREHMMQTAFAGYLNRSTV